MKYLLKIWLVVVIFNTNVFAQNIINAFRQGGTYAMVTSMSVDQDSGWASVGICMLQGYWILGVPGPACVVIGISPDGRPVWQMDAMTNDLKKEQVPYVAVSQGIAYVTDGYGELVLEAVDEKTGRLLWHREVEKEPDSYIQGIVASPRTGNVYVLTNDKFFAWDKKGNKLWRLYTSGFRVHYMDIDARDEIVVITSKLLLVTSSQGKLLHQFDLPKDLKYKWLYARLGSRFYNWAVVDGIYNKKLTVSYRKPGSKKYMKTYNFKEDIYTLGVNPETKDVYLGFKNGEIAVIHPDFKTIKWVTSIGGKSYNYAGVSCHAGYKARKVCGPVDKKGKRHILGGVKNIAFGPDKLLVATSQAGIFTIQDTIDSHIEIKQLHNAMVHARSLENLSKWSKILPSRWNKWINILYVLVTIVLVVLTIFGGLFKYYDKENIGAGVLFLSIMIIILGANGYYKLANMGVFIHYLVPIVGYLFITTLFWGFRVNMKFSVALLIALFGPPILIDIISGPFGFAKFFPSLGTESAIVMDVLRFDSVLIMLAIIPFGLKPYFLIEDDTDVDFSDYDPKAIPLKRPMAMFLVILSLIGPGYVLYSLHSNILYTGIFMIPLLILIIVTLLLCLNPPQLMKSNVDSSV